MTEARLVVVTAPDEEVAVRLSRALLEEGLVACGNVVPRIRSLYVWEGAIHDEAESLILLKTDRSRVSDLIRRIPEMHPYDVPEVLVLSVEAGHEPYLSWVTSATRSRSGDDAG